MEVQLPAGRNTMLMRLTTTTHFLRNIDQMYSAHKRIEIFWKCAAI